VEVVWELFDTPTYVRKMHGLQLLQKVKNYLNDRRLYRREFQHNFIKYMCNSNLLLIIIMEGCVCGCLYVDDNHSSLENGRSSKLQLYLQDDYEMCHVEYNQYSLRTEADCRVRFFR
jgi:hypothetical protein